MVLVIPGVAVSVVKEVVAPQLAPSGVLGLIGVTEQAGPGGAVAVQSWSRFTELFGPASAHSMPEAAQALQNGVAQLVVVPLAAKAAAATLPTALDGATLTLTLRAAGPWANGLKVEVRERFAPSGLVLDIAVRRGESSLEELRGVPVGATISATADAIAARSALLLATGSGAASKGTQTAGPFAQFAVREAAEAAAKVAADGTKVAAALDAAAATLQAIAMRVTGDAAIASTAVAAVRKAGETAATATRPDAKLGDAVTAMATLAATAIGTAVAGAAAAAATAAAKDKPDADKAAAARAAALGVLKRAAAQPGGAGEAAAKLADGLALDAIAAAADTEAKRLLGLVRVPVGPRPGTSTFGGGADAAPDAYAAALQLLESEPDVDMVLAAVQDFSPANARNVAQIYAGVISHCVRMSAQSKGRIGFGQVPPFAAPGSTPKEWAENATQLLSDRFVLLAPHGIAGAVAGMVGSLDYFQSPTFKPILGVTELSRRLYVEEQETLLKAWVVPVATMRGRGTVVVRGLTTDGDQISVRRVADRAVRGVKMIGELFIGRLNNETGRGALREKLTEFLVQMQRDGAIVPSTDGRDPAFKVNVYSSQDDFAKGIVRVDMAVRPVRAIDYIYATVLVQA